MTQQSSFTSSALIRAVLAAALFTAVLVLFVLTQAGVHVLSAAGLTAGSGAIGGVEKFVNSIKGNIIWLAATCATLGGAIIGFLFMSGHSRAQDYAIKAGVGLLIIVAVPGIAS